VFTFLPIEKLIQFVTHLSGEDQQRTFPALVKNALAVPLEKFVEGGGRKLPLGYAHNRTMPDFTKKNTPEYPSTKIINCTR